MKEINEQARREREEQDRLKQEKQAKLAEHHHGMHVGLDKTSSAGADLLKSVTTKVQT